jgi:cytochrome c biogenesis protein
MSTVDEARRNWPESASSVDPGPEVAPAAPPPPRRPGPGNRLLALGRNSWRQLTSMRTALVLLFLLAVAAIPGSVLPQRNINIEKVNQYFVDHPDLAPALDRLRAFDVFASPWFAAIYLLLFTSLVGCIVPRLRDHARALRRVPPDAPRRLDRLPQHAAAVAQEGEPVVVADQLRAMLRRRQGLWPGWRAAVRTHDDGTLTVSAEKGYLKETGNLLFHISLIAVLVGVAFGSWYGWHANRKLVVGSDTAFCNSLQQYEEYGLGARINASGLPRFCLELTDFHASYLDSGQAEKFSAVASVSGPDAPTRTGVEFSVNHPLRLPGANVYLLGHGYAPVLKYTDRYGHSQTTVAPFLPSDAMLTSEGVVAFPDANVDPSTGKRDPLLQVAFQGLYLPTAPDDPTVGRSTFPAERDPGLLLLAYRGDLGMDTGIPSSVYTLNQGEIDAGRLKRVGDMRMLRVGESMTLDDGTKVEFLGTRQYATLSIRYDPGERIVLGSVVLMLAGLMLSLTGKRRRVWFRVSPSNSSGPSTTSGSSMVEAGGLPRTDYPGFNEEFRRIVRNE